MTPSTVPLQAGGISGGVFLLITLLFQLVVSLAIPVGICLVAIFAYEKLVGSPGVDAARVAELERDVAELRLEIERRN